MIGRLTQMDTDFSGKTGIRDPQSYAVIGAAMEVHRELRHGFLEAVYQEALAVESQSRGIPFEREVLLKIFYKGGELPDFYKADFVCFGRLLVECKALAEIGGAEDGPGSEFPSSNRPHQSRLDQFRRSIPAIQAPRLPPSQNLRKSASICG
jgi:GxxExxY protein